MSRTKSDPPLLDALQAAFLGGPVSINAASHDAEKLPSIIRAFGCRVSADRREVVVFLSKPRSAAVLRDLAADAPIAVVFSRPKTHETLQLKGLRARVRPLQPGEREAMLAYGAAFGAELMALGYPEDFTRPLTIAVMEEAVGVAFTPIALFEQTPGPKAGMRLEPRP